jgi:UDP-glucose 4-epimerase
MKGESVRVLVTGAAGYIGSIAVERLAASGHEVIGLDNLWRGHRTALENNVEFLDVDLRDGLKTLEAIRQSKAEAVMHFAAAALVGESVENPAHYFGVNVVGSHNLLTAMNKAEIRKFVFSSTAAVYGDAETIPISENNPLNPINPYGRSKLMVEQMLEWHGSAYGLNYASMRYFNVSGATEIHGEDHKPETHVIPTALGTLMEPDKVFKVFGTDYPTPDGTAIRDYVHVVDLVDAHLLALEKLDSPLGAFNLGTREGFSVMQIVRGIEEVTEKKLSVEMTERRAGDPPALVADSTRARTVLGWNPTRSTLDQMIGCTWKWMNRHPDGYSDSKS